MNFLAQIISAVFAPFVIIVPSAFVLAFLGTHDFYISLMWFLITLFFILGLSLVMHKLIKIGKFSNFDVSIRKQRPLMFAIEFIFAFTYFLFLFLFHAPRELFLGIINILALLITLSIVNRFIKASGHIAMFSAIVVFVVFRSGIAYGLVGVMLVLILAWSRLILKRHTPREILAGLVIGISIASLLNYLSLSFFTFH